MKRKEYYWIGRFLCLLGYLFLALSAILNPWTPFDDFERKTGQLYSLLAFWVYLIPIGFVILAIAGRRKMDIVCAVITVLCCASLYVGWIVEGDTSPLGSFGPISVLLFFFGETISESNQLGLVLLTMILFAGPSAIAAVRAFFVGCWKVPLRILAVLTLIIIVFYVISAAGFVDEGSLFQPVREAMDQWWNSDPQQLEKIVRFVCKLTYVAMMVPAVVFFAAETVYDRKNNLEMR